MHARHRRSPFAITLTIILALTGLASCAPTEIDEGQTDDELTTQEVLDNLGAETVEQELDDFPASPNAKDDVRTWSMFYVRTKDGFDGILTMGVDGAGQVRHLVIADGGDAQRRVVMLQALRDEAPQAGPPTFRRGAFGAGLDEPTTRWIQSELVRMHDALTRQLGEGNLATRSGASDGAKCGLRIATWLAANVGGAFLGPIGYVAATASEEALWAYVDSSGASADRAGASAAAGATSAGINSVVSAVRVAARSSNRTLANVGRAGLGVGGAAIVGLVVLVATQDDGTPWPYRVLPDSCRRAFAR